MNRVMLDLETLGPRSGSVITSIGAVKFDLDGTGAAFHRTIDIVDSQSHGLEIDADTLQWWLEQSDEARKELQGERPLKDVLGQFSSFVKRVDEIWANAPTFDCVILRGAYEAIDRDPPWSFRDERCFRTLRHLPQFIGTDHVGTEHNARDDALSQAEAAVLTLRELEQ